MDVTNDGIIDLEELKNAVIERAKLLDVLETPENTLPKRIDDGEKEIDLDLTEI